LLAREKTAARHGANLLALCDEALRAANLRVGDLAAIACGAGPGGFTGLRVGLAVAKGLALPTNLPLVLISSLEALAHDLAAISATANLLLPCIDAGKGQVYGRVYSTGDSVQPQGEGDWVLLPDQLCRIVQETAAGQTLLAGGTGVDRYLDLFRANLGEQSVHASVPGPSAIAVGRLALARMRDNDYDDIETAVPRYGRPPDITRSKKALLLP
jgi:tRNA threonylcarbamoyladenosine biosynthesis protein TsaB